MTPEQLEAIEARLDRLSGAILTDTLQKDIFSDIAVLLAEVKRLDKIMADISGELDSRKQQLEGK